MSRGLKPTDCCRLTLYASFLLPLVLSCPVLPAPMQHKEVHLSWPDPGLSCSSHLDWTERLKRIYLPRCGAVGALHRSCQQCAAEQCKQRLPARMIQASVVVRWEAHDRQAVRTGRSARLTLLLPALGGKCGLKGDNRLTELHKSSRYEKLSVSVC